MVQASARRLITSTMLASLAQQKESFQGGLAPNPTDAAEFQSHVAVAVRRPAHVR